jgi:hypothetical protein
MDQRSQEFWADVADVIERRGWCQRISQTGAGEVCPNAGGPADLFWLAHPAVRTNTSLV